MVECVESEKEIGRGIGRVGSGSGFVGDTGKREIEFLEGFSGTQDSASHKQGDGQTYNDCESGFFASFHLLQSLTESCWDVKPMLRCSLWISRGLRRNGR